MSVINSYLNLPVHHLQSLILQTQKFILCCHNERRRFSKKLKISKPRDKRKPSKNNVRAVPENSKGNTDIRNFFTTKSNDKENVEPDYGIQNLLGEEENTESELIGGKNSNLMNFNSPSNIPKPSYLHSPLQIAFISGLLGIKSSLIVGQLATEFGRRTL